MAGPIHIFVLSLRRYYGPPPSPPPPMPLVHKSEPQKRKTSFYVIPPKPPEPTIASLAARSITPKTRLRNGALRLHQLPTMSPHLKFRMVVTFTLATMFFAAAKYYFNRQVVRNSSTDAVDNVLAAAAVMACMCSVGCAVSMCRARVAPALAGPRVV